MATRLNSINNKNAVRLFSDGILLYLTEKLLHYFMTKSGILDLARPHVDPSFTQKLISDERH